MECKQCKKKFARKDSLKRHKLSHTRPVFKCKVCPETFSDEDKLQRHAYDHRRVKCRQCVKSFVGKESLKKHVRDMHRPTAAALVVPKAEPVTPPATDAPVAPDLRAAERPDPPAVVPPVSLVDDSFVPTAAVKRQLAETYDDDIVELVLDHWRYVLTMTVVRDPFNTVRQVRLTVPRAALGAALSKLLMDIVLSRRRAFKVDLAFTTVNRSKGGDKGILRYAEKNSKLFSDAGVPVLIAGMDDVPKVLERLGTENVFNFVSMLRPDSHTYVAAVVGVTFFITPVDFPMLS